MFFAKLGFTILVSLTMTMIIFAPMITNVFFGFGFVYTKFMVVVGVIFNVFATSTIVDYYYNNQRRFESDKQTVMKKLRGLEKKYPDLDMYYFVDCTEREHIIAFKDPLLCTELIENLQKELEKKLYFTSWCISYNQEMRLHYQLIYKF